MAPRGLSLRCLTLLEAIVRSGKQTTSNALGQRFRSRNDVQGVFKASLFALLLCTWRTKEERGLIK